VPAFQLSGKVALVTGAARGIGLETARALHARGASVVVNDLDPEATARAAAQVGERATGAPADVTDADAMAEVVQTAVDTYGGLDVVVANAGIGPPPMTMLKADRGHFERTLEVDLQGVWRTVSPALDQIAARQGQVVVISSVYAFMNGMVASPYAAAKAGVEALGRALRVELSIHGAGATVAHFGFIDTVMVQEAFDEEPEGSALLDFLPSFVTRRLTPGQAAEALVSGIERRAPRVIAPSWWRVLYHLRGLTGPLMDWVSTRDRRVIEALRDLEARDQSGSHTTTPAA
jgi:NAD(P)-dependent dehydrogenase (short-subunit alcohol dehydrogenase family)